MTNLNIKSKSRGFTIVELLVVIVVIGILAAISIVSYTGVTNRANSARALSNANSIISAADAYNAENGKYPAISGSGTTLTAGTYATAPSSIKVYSTAPTAANGLDNIGYVTCGTPATGANVTYWEYAPAVGSALAVTLKTGSGC